MQRKTHRTGKRHRERETEKETKRKDKGETEGKWQNGEIQKGGTGRWSAVIHVYTDTTRDRATGLPRQSFSFFIKFLQKAKI